MIHDPTLPRAEAHGTGRLRPPGPKSVVQTLALLAAACVGAALGVSAWLAAGLAVAALVVAGTSTVYLRAVNRALNRARCARSEWERRYRRIYDSVAVGIFRAGPDCRLTGANRGLLTLLGYASEQALLDVDFGQQAYVGPGTFEVVLRRARKEGTLENLELRLRRFDGLTVTVLATVQAIWDEAGDVSGFEATVVDITRERLAESQRRSMERRFRRLFDSNAVGVLVGNLRRGTLEEANPALTELFGLRPSELPMPLEQVIPPDQRPLHRTLRAALEMSGTAGPLASEYVRADGVRIPVLISAALVEPQPGEFVAVVVDRTREASDARRAALLQQLHDAMLEDAPMPAAVIERERGLLRCNQALREWLAGAREPQGCTLADLLGPACPAAVGHAAQRAFAGESAELLVEVEHGGRARRLALTLVPRCSESGAGASVLAFIRDAAEAVVAPASGTAAATATGPACGDCAEGRRTA